MHIFVLNYNKINIKLFKAIVVSVLIFLIIVKC